MDTVHVNACCIQGLSVCLCSAALEVELSDDSFPPEDFGIVSGMLNVKWDRIAPYPSVLMCPALR